MFSPRPAPPVIWIGGNGEKALARVLEFGEGWHPMMPVEKLRSAVTQLKQKLAANHKSEIEIVVRRVMRFDDLGAAKAKVQAERDAGATYFILDLGRYPNEREFAAQAETFMLKVASRAG